MKLLLLGFALAALMVGSANAQCAHGMAYFSQGTPAKPIAMSKPKKPEKIKTAKLVDHWLIKYLDKPIS